MTPGEDQRNPEVEDRRQMTRSDRRRPDALHWQN